MVPLNLTGPFARHGSNCVLAGAVGVRAGPSLLHPPGEAARGPPGGPGPPRGCPAPLSGCADGGAATLSVSSSSSCGHMLVVAQLGRRLMPGVLGSRLLALSRCYVAGHYWSYYWETLRVAQPGPAPCTAVQVGVSGSQWSLALSRYWHWHDSADSEWSMPRSS